MADMPYQLFNFLEIYTTLTFTIYKIMTNYLIIKNIFQAVEQARRYDGLASQCKSVSGLQDLGNLARVLPVPPNALKIPKKAFAPPQPPPTADGEEIPDYNVRVFYIFFIINLIVFIVILIICFKKKRIPLRYSKMN